MKCLLGKCARNSPPTPCENSESLALGYLAASLRADGYEGHIVNSAIRGVPVASLIPNPRDPDLRLLGLSVPDASLVEPTLAAVTDLRERGLTAHVTLGGHTATFHYADILQMCPEVDSLRAF